MVEGIIDTCLRESVRLNDVLHGFSAGRDMWMEILELMLAQELVIVDQDPLFLVLLDLRKDYDTVDCGRLLVTLERYGTKPHT